MSNGEEKTTLLWQRYQNGLKYQATMGLSDKLPKQVAFYEGRQWPRATKATASLPRITANFIRMVVRNKKAVVMGSPLRCVFKPADTGTDTLDGLQDFYTYISAEIGQEELDRRAFLSGAVKGTYIYHYYWDSEARGMEGTKDGGLRCELIDPLRIFFEDPSETDEQKQGWIMMVSREPVEAVRAKADKGVNPEDIVPDERDRDPYQTKEQEGSQLVTVLTCYSRRDGEVYCEKATRQTVVNEAFPITPDIEAAERAIEEAMAGAGKSADKSADDPANSSLPDKAGEGGKKVKAVKKARSYLYPLVVASYEPREGSIFGISEVEGLIHNQQSVNLVLSMMVKNVQDTAWSKWVVKHGALRGQVINNEPGQLLEDYYQQGDGIKRIEAGGISAAPQNLVDAIMGVTRSVTGSTEVMTGEVKSGMSGAAIAQLQAQANLPSEDLRAGFKNAKIRQGRVLEQFFRTHYAGGRTYIKREPDYEHQAEDGTLPEKRTEQVFNSSMLKGRVIDIVVEAVTGTRSSSAADIQMLETLFAKGAIDAKTMIEAYPPDALGSKTEIMRAIAMREQSQMLQLAAENEQLKQQAAQNSDLMARIEALVQANQKLSEENLMLYTEAKSKLTLANMETRKANDQYRQAFADARALAAEKARAEGLTGDGGPFVDPDVEADAGDGFGGFTDTY